MSTGAHLKARDNYEQIVSVVQAMIFRTSSEFHLEESKTHSRVVFPLYDFGSRQY